MKIAVIGSSGFIGTTFVREAIAVGHSILGWDIVKPREEHDKTHFVYNRWVDGEFENIELLRECDAVLILAAKRPHNRFDMQDYFDNIGIVAKVLECCIEHEVKNIVTISSRSVYSNENLPWREKDSNVPLNLYGAAKAAVDDLIKLYNKKYNLRIKSLRLAQVIGLGEVSGYLLNTFIERALQKQELHIYGTGEGRRQYIYIKDVVSAILHAVESDTEGVFNIGMQENVSSVELAQIVNTVFGNEKEICFEADKPEDLKHYLMDVTKAKKEFGWEAKYTVEAAMKDIRKMIDEGKNE